MAYGRKRSNKGKTCIKRKRVHVRGYGMALRCVKYGPKRSAGRKTKRRGKKRGGYRKGHRPFNKGKTCKQKGRNRLGRVTCRSYGKVYGSKHKNRRRSRPEGDSFVNTQRAYENKMRRVMYNTPDTSPAEDMPAWAGGMF